MVDMSKVIKSSGTNGPIGAHAVAPSRAAVSNIIAGGPAANPFVVERAVDAEPFIKLFMYGATGIGKTYLAATAHDCIPMRDVLFLNAEGGTATLVNMGKTDVDVITVKNWPMFVRVYDFLAAYCKLKNKPGVTEAELRAFLTVVNLGDRDPLPDYNTVVIDTIDEIQEYCMKHILGMDPQSTKLGTPYNKPGWPEYGELLDRMKTVARNFRNLPMHVIVTCHQEIKQDDNQRVYIEPSLVGKFAVAAQAYFDFVGYYVARHAISKGGPIMERRMYITPGPNYAAKNRCNVSTGWLSEPTMGQIYKLLKSGAAGIITDAPDGA